MSTNSPQTHRFIIMTVDPVHIGTGGMRLGRVDNAIVREPGTNLPKIPGTALHGVIRGYAARRLGKPQCAGQGSRENKHCGRPTCPICYTFGSIQEDAGAFSGVVSIYDARILLFPVYSMVGPVWVTTPEILMDAGFGNNYNVTEGKAKWDKITENNSINLGWLMVERDGNSWKPPGELTKILPQSIQDRIVLVSGKLFPQIVNSNLEVRTSVAINPATGAAEEGALFTYEALPRTTFLWFDVVVDDFKNGFPADEIWKEKIKPIENISLPTDMPEDESAIEKVLRELGYIDNRPVQQKEEKDDEFEIKKKGYWTKVTNSFKILEDVMNLTWRNPLDIVSLGLEWAEYLGIGGMGTRGFGRIRKIIHYEVEENSIENRNNGGKNDQTNS